MKKILIIEDDQIITNIYRNKLTVEGYQVESALDGETGLKLIQSFQPEAVVLDLMLPKMSGIEVIKKIRGDAETAKLPVIVFSNIYLTNMIQDAWKAGATKCLSKTGCTPRDFIEVVRQTIGDSGAVPRARSGDTKFRKKPKPPTLAGAADSEFHADLRKSFIDSLPVTLATLRADLKNLTKSDRQAEQLQHIHLLYRRMRALTGNAGVVNLTQIAQMSGAIEALLKELYEKPENINPSTLRTVVGAVDFLGFLFERGTASGKHELPAANVLVVDDEPISRRAIIYALEKAFLQSVEVGDPKVALEMLTEKKFDLVFLDVDMPGMTGFELCTKLRALPQHKKTPVVFVTNLGDFDNRTSSTMAGGNDFIAKPFLFIELTVKALIHVLRSKLQAAK
ncbi:MAG TPA: response regulator [Verrucomicrobiae bacterium]|nr:response regulator [Verrucomicrobiae bacterium]